jgi:hypothetical protein
MKHHEMKKKVGQSNEVASTATPVSAFSDKVAIIQNETEMIELQ